MTDQKDNEEDITEFSKTTRRRFNYATIAAGATVIAGVPAATAGIFWASRRPQVEETRDPGYDTLDESPEDLYDQVVRDISTVEHAATRMAVSRDGDLEEVGESYFEAKDRYGKGSSHWIGVNQDEVAYGVGNHRYSSTGGESLEEATSILERSQ